MEIMSPKKKTSYVPNDIMIDILSWVPAKSLLRLRWACKHWFHLITRDTSFANLHLHCSTTSTTTIHHPHNLSVLISKPWGPRTCKIFQYYIDYSTTTSGSFSCGETKPILSGIFVGFRFLGSCHGLILFSYLFPKEERSILCIWNPCTKEYKYLPKPPYSFDGYEITEVNTKFGLGYDHSIQDYKVICNVKSRDGTSFHVQVYALRTNSSWKYIRSFPTNYYTMFVGNGVFVNGALHFIYDEQALNPGRPRKILSFDFEKEVYVEISNQPECLNNMSKSIRDEGTLTMFEGSLCLTMSTNRTMAEAWVMKKDYNMNNNQEYSWSNLYEIPYFYSYTSDTMQPLRFTKDGEILFLTRSEHQGQGLLLFDRKNNKVTTHKVYKLPPIEQAATTTTLDTNKTEVVYIESLVSLNSGTYIDEKGDYMHYWQEDTNSGTFFDEIDYMAYFGD